MTYHAGEDFLDLTDGLRAIDEVIRFCGLHRGSRIGHALALGLNPYKYYEYKNWEVILTKQILLDDLAWILNQAKAIGCMTDYELKMKLESQFHTSLYIFIKIAQESLDLSAFRILFKLIS